MTASLSPVGAKVAAAAGWTPPVTYDWTQSVCGTPLAIVSVSDLVTKVEAAAKAQKLVLPGGTEFVRSCVLALLSGHLCLQGPPGTGKTSFARCLAEAFDAALSLTTATADWSTYDVVGGLRPSESGELLPTLGAVSRAALACAEVLATGAPSPAPRAHWLVIDELNRADIDKAIGSLYTVLSSVSAAHLLASPLELWFESAGRTRLWFPASFRIIATMNDVDTSFVNALSQGLTRRFQFLTLGVAAEPGPIATEVANALEQAHDWVVNVYPSVGTDTLPALRAGSLKALEPLLTQLLLLLRNPRLVLPDAVNGWPVGTAQVVDILRALVLEVPTVAATPAEVLKALDRAVADRFVPQMGNLDEDQLDAFEALFRHTAFSLDHSAKAVARLRDTRSGF